MNSRGEHFTSFCENSEPIVARTVAGSNGSQSGLSMKIPLAPAASAVRIIVPRLPGDSIDSTASHREFLSILHCCREVHCFGEPHQSLAVPPRGSYHGRGAAKGGCCEYRVCVAD